MSVEYTSSGSVDKDLSSNYGLKIRNTDWNSNQLTGIEFWNGLNKVVATSRIISQMATGGATGDNLLFQTQTNSGTNPNPNQPSTKMVILSGGNVGIGTTEPKNKLNIVGATNSTTGFIVNANVGITGNYSVGNCWMAYSGGINYGTNCSAI